MSFIFGGDTPWTYDQVQQKRKLAQMLQAANTKTPRNVGEGLGAIGRALQIRGTNKRADKRQGELDTASKAIMDAIKATFGGGGGTPFVPGNASPQAVSTESIEGQGVADDTMAMLIRQDLEGKGYPSHVAEAFIDNFKDESGLNPSINEQSPTVPGSRGGFGLAQWTGPRRVALEQFAATNGLDINDFSTQTAFLDQELQGPERKARDAIFAAPNRGAAGAAIVNQFLRPAEQHRAAREAKYTGGASQGSQGDMMPALMAAMQDKNLMSNPGSAMLVSALLKKQMEGAPKGTDDMREYEFAKQQGFQGSFMDFMTGMRKAGASKVSVTNTGPKPGRYIYAEDAGLPKGWRFDTETQTSEMIPEGPVALEAAQDASKAANKTTQQKLKLGTTLTSLSLNIKEIEDGGLPVTGAWGDARRSWIGRAVTGSDAVDFKTRSDQVTDSAALAEIQNMRDNSKTGGAVGNLTDGERIAIGNAVTALNSAGSKEEYLRAAKAFRDLSLNLAYGEGLWELGEDGITVNQTIGGIKPDIEGGGWVTINGVRVRAK